MNSPGPSPADIQSHLYQSFLQRSTADVALRVSGTWSAIYRLHRVVLIQSGFFRSLFTAGFSESSHVREIEVSLDDANITRAAFELCVARLYGGGPALYVHPSIIPNSASPLTPGFPYPQVDASVFGAPDGQQPATPRFLMSLLATSLYFSIPSIASQALSLILKTIGPYTIVPYLNFALGNTVEYDDILSSAVGLEAVAEILHEEDTEFESDFEDTSESIQREAPPAGIPHTFHYGAISDKIGEACATWLSRWGADIFLHEEYDVLKGLECDSSNAATIIARRATSRPRAKTLPSTVNNNDGALFRKRVIPALWTGDGLSVAWIRALISSDSFFIEDEHARYEFAKRVVEVRRRLKLLERKSQVPVKGKEKVVDGDLVQLDEAEEKEWAILFETGIYYANMTPDVFLKLSNDISPTTRKPYISLSVLHAAGWDHLLLRHAITERQVSPTASPTSPTPSKGDLGIMVNGVELLSSATISQTPRNFYLVPTDESLRIGDTINVSGIGAVAEGNIHNNVSMDQLFASSHAATRPTKGDKVSITDSGPFTPDSRTYFGLVGDALVVSSAGTRIKGIEDSRIGLSSGLSERLSKRTYSPHPPYRFSVEFWDLDSLKDKQRLHSKTIWYAGSLFNVYVQLIRKKDKPGTGGVQHQLGIYLHRQSTVESIPLRSAPNPRIRKQEEEGRGALCLPDGLNSPAGLYGAETLSKSKHTPSPSLPEALSLSVSTASGSLYTTQSIPPTSPSTPPTRSGTASPITGSSHRVTSSLFTPSPRATSSLLPSLSSSLPSPSGLRRTPSPFLSPNLISATTSSSTSVGGDLNNSVSGVSASPLPSVIPPLPPSSQPYRDPRTVVSVYFSVLCSSPTGSAQTQFRSGPDVFKISQSWGWKSGGLLSVKAEDSRDSRASDSTGSGSTTGHGHLDVPGREVSLRATVLLGVV
ncbi:hypothetical protein D9758_006020 [Tetrapyrgos nigripes]|uniref:BTB domain-containing protein n=1 Tax=Tetrapyrgos nigripes TaxID=182062 RepID=A0A8H5D9P0_9AGAR|nr:hypothetical protein D9758_006020 [Tetrapyrgos nigripes]